MKVYREKTAYDFLVNNAWEVNEDLASLIQDYGKINEFNDLAEHTFPDGVSFESLNDWM